MNEAIAKGRQDTFTRDEALRFIRELRDNPTGYRPGRVRGLDEQTAFILKQMLIRRTCPSCGLGLDVFDAAPDHAYVFGAERHTYRCDSCHRPLKLDLALFGGEYYWSIDHEREEGAGDTESPGGEA